MRKIILLMLVASLIFMFATPAGAHGEALEVFYAGEAGRVETALRLADSFEQVADPAQADVIVLNGVIPDPAALHDLVAGGAGLVLIMGPEIPAESLSALLGINVVLEPGREPLSLIEAPTSGDPILTDIVWNSAPQVRERSSLVSGPADFNPIVVGQEQPAFVLGETRLGLGQVFVFTPYLDGVNPQFQNWPYFNYFIYHLVTRAGGETPLSFAGYPASPVPHTQDRLVLFGLLGGMLLTALLVFLGVRRYSRAHPELLDNLVLDRERYVEKQVKSDWNEIGFHRPLGGFMLAFMLGLVLFIPYIIYQNMILPGFILPSAQALGIWGRVVQAFQFLWLLFDMGTSVAFIKYFSEYRVHDPRRAIQFGQVFVWWQALSGAVQVAMMTALASFVVPDTVYALYAWSIIVHTLIQIPGFLLVMRHALLAWQRFDYAQILDMGQMVFFPMITQPVIVTLFVWWASSNPVFGLAMGGLLGLGLAAYASEMLAFLLGLWMYRRAGYSARVLFLAHFDWNTVKSSFRFGVFEMLGSVAWAAGQALEIFITQTRLVNYTEIWGNWIVAQNFVFAFSVLQTLYNSVMPSISEAISNARVTLSQYYAAMSYKWGGIISAFVGAVLLAVADRFILGATGPEFVRAALYAIPLIIWGAIQYPSWVADSVQLASNRPYLKSALVIFEQTIRILLAFLLLERFQINALIIAYFVGLLSKDILAYWVNHKLCFPQRFYFWQSLGAPLLAGGVHWALLRTITGLIWQGDTLTSILIFLLGILFSYPVYAFLYGLFGGWDDDTLAETLDASRLSNFVRPMVWLFWAASSLGARLSPLHGRFPIDIRARALGEADSLELERVDLV